MNLPEKVALPSGASLELKDPPFESSMKLLTVVANEAKLLTTGLKVDINFASDPQALARLLAQDLPIDLIKNAVCQLVASESVRAAMLECMGRCLYNGQSATLASFEPRNARQDYLLAAWEVMKFNLLPFFAGLTSRSSTNEKPTGGAQR